MDIADEGGHNEDLRDKGLNSASRNRFHERESRYLNVNGVKIIDNKFKQESNNLMFGYPHSDGSSISNKSQEHHSNK